MERKVFEDQLYALEERFKAWDKDMRSLLAKALWESGTVMFVDVDGGIRSEDSLNTSQGIYPLLAAVRDELKAREGIKI